MRDQSRMPMVHRRAREVERSTMSRNFLNFSQLLPSHGVAHLIALGPRPIHSDYLSYLFYHKQTCKKAAMHICRNASSDTCRWMPKLFKPLKIEIAIEALGNNTLVKAKSWGGPINRVPPQPADWGAAMNICCNAFSDTCRRMPKLIRPLKSEIAIETLRSNTLVKAKSWGEAQ